MRFDTCKFDLILEAKQLQNFLLPQAGIQSQPFESSADPGNLAEIFLTQVAEYMEPNLVGQLDCERVKLARHIGLSEKQTIIVPLLSWLTQKTKF